MMAVWLKPPAYTERPLPTATSEPVRLCVTGQSSPKALSLESPKQLACNADPAAYPVLHALIAAFSAMLKLQQLHLHRWPRAQVCSNQHQPKPRLRYTQDPPLQHHACHHEKVINFQPDQLFELFHTIFVQATAAAKSTGKSAREGGRVKMEKQHTGLGWKLKV